MAVTVHEPSILVSKAGIFMAPKGLSYRDQYAIANKVGHSRQSVRKILVIATHALRLDGEQLQDATVGVKRMQKSGSRRSPRNGLGSCAEMEGGTPYISWNGDRCDLYYDGR